jgi:hypothetical protein
MLLPEESRVVNSVLSAEAVDRAALERKERDASEGGSRSNDGVLICSAYSDDYTIGRLSEAVNRAYAALHGYRFWSVVLPYEDMLGQIAPRMHVTWFKVLLLRDLLAQAKIRGISWVMWIDADAIVIEPSVRVLEDIVASAGARELVIGEDMNPSCLINAGVMLVRVCAWSVALWDDVWASKRYWSVPFYEQSALIGALRARQEGLEAVRPFHSHVRGGPQGPKHFAHTCVLPSLDFNSNRFAPESHESARYIYHAAGIAEGGKLAALQRVLAACSIDVPEGIIPASMHLFRGSHGRPPKPDRVAARAAVRAALMPPRDTGTEGGAASSKTAADGMAVTAETATPT